jgi:hypothetical protein
LHVIFVSIRNDFQFGDARGGHPAVGLSLEGASAAFYLIIQMFRRAYQRPAIHQINRGVISRVRRRDLRD